MEKASDEAIWQFAKERSFTIVSKDSDFHQRSFLLGPPPKAVWIRVGNCSTKTILQILRSRATDLQAFQQDPQAAFLILSR